MISKWLMLLTKNLKYIFILFLLIGFGGEAYAQWTELKDFEYPVSSIYFMNEFGKPNIGFVGTGYNYSEGSLWRTEDGGKNWLQVTPLIYNVTDICFKDTLTGWISVRTPNALDDG